MPGYIILQPWLDRWHLENNRLHEMIEDQAFRFASSFALPAESFAAAFYSLSLDSFIQLQEQRKFSILLTVKRRESLHIGTGQSLRNMRVGLALRAWRRASTARDKDGQQPL